MSTWYTLPDDDDRGPAKGFPRLDEGAELDARVNGEVVRVTVSRRGGVGFLDARGEAVEPDAIRVPPMASRSGRSRTYAERKATMGTRVSAELNEPTLRKLDELCDDGGMSRADMIRAMIDAEWAEWRGLITSGRKPDTRPAG